ncbi:MAG: ATP-dependent 6-phosphofructokinase [Proteobacteria bacterium]|nr:ATP-dependent 6-phosphofructokinase [Pseudomonadota bacterium]
MSVARPSSSAKLALLTSGGDCAGLNAVIRAVVIHATHNYGWEVIGIQEGTHGLLFDPPHIQKLDPGKLDFELFRKGGTILGTTNKGDPFSLDTPTGKKDCSKEMIARLKALGCGMLIGVGGDGSMSILKRLADLGGIRLVGIPKTIDNDVGATEISIGFSTAVDIATEALDRLQPTAASHNRVMVLEVMGRDAGHIALHAGVAGGADVILIPEIPYDIKKVAAHINGIRKRGRNFALIIVSEAVPTKEGRKIGKVFAGGQKRLGGIGDYIGEQIAEMCQAEVRVTVLGHVQRGGPPNATDRTLATAMGVHAVDLLAKGAGDRMVCWINRQVESVKLGDAIATYRAIEQSDSMITAARALGVCFGN